jgi:hypothetical protein
MRSLFTVAALTLGLVSTLLSQTPTVIESTLGPSANSRFGVRVALTSDGDLDGDFRADLIVGVPNAANGRGEVHVRLSSGPTRVIAGPAGQAGFGARVAVAGDVDYDNYPDIMASSVGSFVWIISGRTMQLIRQHTSSSSRWGEAVAGLGDLDGDGAADYGIGDFSYNSGRGLVHVRSGRTGALIRSHSGSTATSGSNSGDHLGATLARVGDTNGDGVSDYLYAAPRWDSTRAGTDHGYVAVINGRTGAVLRRHDGVQDQARYGQDAGGIGDADGDGVPDYAYTNRDRSRSDRRVRIASGGTGSQILGIGSPGVLGFGDSILGGDFNRDGRSDIIIGAADLATNPTAASEVFIYSLAGGGASLLYRWTAANPGTQLGRSISAASYRDGGANMDIAIGEPNFGQANRRGRVRVWEVPNASTASAERAVNVPGASSSQTSTPGIRPLASADQGLRAGATKRLTSTGWRPGALVVLVLGTPGTTPLPAAPGCNLYVNSSFFVVGGTTTSNSAGVAGINVPTPNGLGGITLRSTWLGTDAANNPLGVATTNGISLVVGGR